MERKVLKVLEEDLKDRLDIYISDKLDEVSRNLAQKLIKDGKVTVDGRLKKPKYMVKTGEEILIEMEQDELQILPEDIYLNIVYEDDYLAVVNKPQGMVVHPATGNYTQTLVNGLIYHLDSLSDLNGSDRPGIVHRIDKDTSGLLIVAKNNFAHEHLAKQLKAHTTNRRYYALVEGVIKEDSGRIDAPIARHKTDRKKMTVSEESERNAVTHFKVLQRFKEHTLIEARLETGRTHQIRVHMKFINHPVVGDKVYGYKNQKFNLEGQLLHAKTIGFIHPQTEEYMEFSSELPSYFEELLKKLKQ